MKLRNLGYAGVLCGLTAAGLSAAFSQERQRTTTTVRTEQRSRGTEVRRVSTVVGGHFAISGGEDFGKIEDLVINDRGCIEYVVIVHEDHYIPVPWTVVEVDYAKNVVMVDITRERLLEAPSFAGWVEFTKTDWRDKTTKHFESHRERRTDVRGDRKNERGKNDDRREPPTAKRDGKGDAPEKVNRENKADDKKSDEKKPAPKKSDDKKSDEKKPDDKKDEKKDEKKDKPS